MAKLKYLSTFFSVPAFNAGIIFILSLICQPLYAEQLQTEDSPRMAIGARAGSVGWGLEYSMEISKPVYLRFVWQKLSPGDFKLETGLEDTLFHYKTDGNFQTTGLISDWYPWDSSIRLSFGILHNSSEFNIEETTPTSSVLNRYNADFGKLAYFFGTGWAARQNPRKLSLTLDMGLLAQQPAQVIWLQDNQARDTNETQRIWSEKSAITREMEDYKILPFFMIGLNYQFF